MKVISFLGIPDEQKPLLAAKWHRWRARRVALDKKLVAAFHTFNQSLPSCDSLPRALLAALESYCPRDEEGDVQAAVVMGLERRGSDSGSGEICGGLKRNTAAALGGAQGFTTGRAAAEESLKDGTSPPGFLSASLSAQL